MLPGYDVAMDDEDPRPPTLNHDHGTHVTGLIAAKTNNGYGMASLAHGVKIYPIKASTDDNANEVSNGLEGIAWATTAGAHVINLSWGSPTSSQTGLLVIQNAYTAGIVIVASAGNGGNTDVTYPAAYPHVLSVAALNNLDTKASFSTYGKWIDVSAPGVQIWSLAPQDSFKVKDGTSFAAPLVAGLAALMLSKNNLLTVDQVENCIESSCENIDIFNNSYVGLLGAGRINAEQALICVTSENAENDISIASVLSPESSQCSSALDPIIRVRNDGSDTLYSFTVKYQLDSEFPLEYSWNGILEPGSTDIISMPQMNAIPGAHILRISINPTLNQNSTDAYLPNNTRLIQFQVFTEVGQSLPFSETFESGNFSFNKWTVTNPSSDFTWEIVPSEGTAPGSRSARLPYFLDFQSGSRDFLVSPALNFKGYSAITLTFKHAYQAKIQGVTDSLIVSVSSDCGQSWIRLKSMGEGVTRTFSTSPITGQFFLPGQIEDWCGQPTYSGCSTISLTPYAGLSGVRIRFEGYNSFGNNIYIDNVNISGTVVNTRPEANFFAANSISACVQTPVTFSNTSLYQPTTYKWKFPGATPDSSVLVNPVVSYANPGVYPATLIAINSSGRDTLIRSDYIHVFPKPVITATATPDTLCRGSSTQLSGFGGVAYLWNSGAGLTSQLADTVIASPQNNANYTLTGIDTNGCTNVAGISVTVVNLPSQPVLTLLDTFPITIMSSVGISYDWYVNGVLLENEHDQQITATVNGNYNVRVYDIFGCSAVSAPLIISTVGFKKLNPEKVVVYPNPAIHDLSITNIEGVRFVELVSVSGQFVSSTKVVPSDKTITIPLDQISSGVYFLRVYRKSETDVFKVIVME
jgi:PKD repeat protein